MGIRHHRALVSAMFAVIMSWSMARSAEPVAAKSPVAGKAAVIPVKGVIIPDQALMRMLVSKDGACLEEMALAAIDRAEKDGADCIVIEMDTPGGVVDSCDKIAQRLISSRLPSIALVTKSAISGGSMIATACDRIVMVEGATIGDCEPHAINQELPDAMREKIESAIRARMRANAQSNGHPDRLLEAMVTKSMDLYYVEMDDSSKRFLSTEELDALKKAQADKKPLVKIRSEKRLDTATQLLTLSAREALEYGLAAEIKPNADEFYRELGKELMRLETFREAQSMSNALLMILVLCLVIGAAGTIVELNTPGFGVPGIIGIIGFSSFFAILLFNGRAEWWEVSLFVVGLALLLTEIFILPGFGVPGVIGVVCVGAAIIMGLLPPLSSITDWRGEGLQAVSIAGTGMFGATILGILLFKYMERIPVLRTMILQTNLQSGQEALAGAIAAGTPLYESHEDAAKSHLGDTGISLTVLRPAGKMRTDKGAVLDVVSDGGMIGKDVRVRVISVNGPRIAVEPEQRT